MSLTNFADILGKDTRIPLTTKADKNKVLFVQDENVIIWKNITPEKMTTTESLNENTTGVTDLWKGSPIPPDGSILTSTAQETDGNSFEYNSSNEDNTDDGNGKWRFIGKSEIATASNLSAGIVKGVDPELPGAVDGDVSITAGHISVNPYKEFNSQTSITVGDPVSASSTALTFTDNKIEFKNATAGSIVFNTNAKGSIQNLATPSSSNKNYAINVDYADTNLVSKTAAATISANHTFSGATALTISNATGKISFTGSGNTGITFAGNKGQISGLADLGTSPSGNLAVNVNYAKSLVTPITPMFATFASGLNNGDIGYDPSLTRFIHGLCFKIGNIVYISLSFQHSKSGEYDLFKVNNQNFKSNLSYLTENTQTYLLCNTLSNRGPIASAYYGLRSSSNINSIRFWSVDSSIIYTAYGFWKID
jgi:hypothetical protein